METNLNFFILDALPFPRPESADPLRRRMIELAAPPRLRGRPVRETSRVRAACVPVRSPTRSEPTTSPRSTPSSLGSTNWTPSSSRSSSPTSPRTQYQPSAATRSGGTSQRRPREGERRTFSDNRQERTVAEAIRQFALYSEHRWPVAIATGCFDLGGFSVIADTLRGGTRGPHPHRRGAAPPRAALAGARGPQRGRRRGSGGLDEALVVERDLAPFDVTTARQIERLLAFLGRPTTEVRIYRERFLHGKAFVFGHEAGVVASSATHRRRTAWHSKLDLGQFEPERVGQVVAWFENLWGAAQPLHSPRSSARAPRRSTHAIYLGCSSSSTATKELQDEEAVAPPAGGMRLASFQRLGVLRAQRILAQRGGVLIADGVGLSKTFIAGDLIRSAIVDEGVRALLITPASLRDSVWENFRSRFQLGVEN